MPEREILTLEEVNSFLDYLKLFIIDINACTDNIEQIILAQETINLIPIQSFLGHYVYLAYSQCAINTYKIFHNGEKRSFYKLFNKIRDFDYSPELKQHFADNKTQNDNLVTNKTEFKKLVDELTTKISSKSLLIEKIKDRRSTFYAHSDPSKQIKSETLKEIKELLDFSIELYNIFYGRFKGITFFFNPNLVSISNVLEDRKFMDNYLKKMESSLY